MTLKKINLSDIKKIDIINVKGGLTASQVKQKYNPDIFVNLALYAFDGNQNITYIEDENIKDGYLFSNEGIGIEGLSKIVWCNKDTAYQSTLIRDWVAGSPTLVKNSKQYVNWGNKVGSHNNGSHLRTAIGFNDNELFLFASDNKLTITETANEMIRFGCRFAINCDGGGSCHLETKLKVYKKSTRSNASWLLIYLKDKKEENKDEENMNKQYSIMIDAGHGQTDSGAVGKVLGLKEKEITLKLSKFLEKELVRNGIKTYQTRTDDKRLVDNDKAKDLSARCKKANDLKVDYFVSLHTNSATSTSAKGIETFSLAKTGNGSNLAHTVQLELDRLGRPSRGKKEANFAVLRETNMSSILIELCFISNEEEEKLLSSDEFLNKSAILIAKGICKHLNIIYKEKEESKQPEGENMDKKYPADLSEWAKTAYDFVVENNISDGTNPKLNVTAERLWGMLYKFDQYLKKESGK